MSEWQKSLRKTVKVSRDFIIQYNQAVIVSPYLTRCLSLHNRKATLLKQTTKVDQDD